MSDNNEEDKIPLGSRLIFSCSAHVPVVTSLSPFAFEFKLQFTTVLYDLLLFYNFSLFIYKLSSILLQRRKKYFFPVCWFTSSNCVWCTAARFSVSRKFPHCCCLHRFCPLSSTVHPRSGISRKTNHFPYVPYICLHVPQFKPAFFVFPKSSIHSIPSCVCLAAMQFFRRRINGFFSTERNLLLPRIRI